MKSKIYFLFLFIFLLTVAQGQTVKCQNEAEYEKSAQRILQKYEQNAYKLKPSKAGHMGLRLWRNYQDDEYRYLLLQGINYTAHSLDRMVVNGLDNHSLERYANESNKTYKTSSEKKKRRQKTLENFPMYRLMAAKILRHVARLDELGLQHEHHDEFMQLIASYDYKSAFTNPQMIRAWGAQLANQVYWLHQLGVADYRTEFVQAVRKTYPDELDNLLSKQQYENKIYTLTHIIIAASEYYRYPVKYEKYRPIINYMRANAPIIIERVKEDVLIEVGLSLLLVNESYPEIDLIKSFVHQRVDKKKKMILSESGNSKFAQGEHRNIIAILLLDWRGCSVSPQAKDIKKMKSKLAGSLVLKDEET